MRNNTLHLIAALAHYVAFASVLVLYNTRDMVNIFPGLYRHSIGKDDSNKITSEKVVEINPDALYILIMIFEFLTFIFHILQYIRDYSSYEVNVYRWVEYSITASIMIFLISIISGVKSFDSILSNVLCTIVIMSIGLLVEDNYKNSNVQNNNRNRIKILTILGWILFSLVWYNVITSFNYTLNDVERNIDYEGTIPEIVKYIVYILLILYGCFGIVQIVQISNNKTEKNHIKIERSYIILSFIAKITLSGMIIGGLTRPKTE